MKINNTEPSNVIQQVAAAYGFELRYFGALNKWVVQAKLSGGVELCWKSDQTEQDFFDELRSAFNREGVEQQVPY